MLKGISDLAISINGATAFSMTEVSQSLKEKADQKFEVAKAKTISKEHGDRALTTTTSKSGWGQTTIYYDSLCKVPSSLNAKRLDTCRIDSGQTSGYMYSSCSVDSVSGMVTIEEIIYSGTGCTGTPTTISFGLGSSLCTDKLDGTYSKVACVSSPDSLDYGTK